MRRPAAGLARRPRRPRSAAAASRSSSRATSSTLAPSAQSSRAVSRPIPRLAPVTTQAASLRARGPSERPRPGRRSSTVVSPASALWTGHLRRPRAGGSRCSSLEPGREAHGDVEGASATWPLVGRRRRRPRRAPMLPALALRVHLHRHRGAGGEAGGEQAGGGGTGVGAAGVGGLVDDERVAALDLDLVGEARRSARSPSASATFTAA